VRERGGENRKDSRQIAKGKSPEFGDPARRLLHSTFLLVFTEFVPNANISLNALIFTFLQPAFQLKNAFAFHYLISLLHRHIPRLSISLCVLFFFFFLCFFSIILCKLVLAILTGNLLCGYSSSIKTNISFCVLCFTTKLKAKRERDTWRLH